jgi:citrate synthase
MSEVLFQITNENLETGMRGYPVGYCTTSSVDPVKGLFYVGRPVSELDSWEPESVIYLLYHGKEGTREEVKKFADDLRSRASCSPSILKYLYQFPKEAHPMQFLCHAISLCGIFEGKQDYHEDGLNIIAKIPFLVAHLINEHAGWGSQKPSRPELGYMENFVQMLNVPKSDLEELTSVFKLFNILHYDHGGGNLSTFIGKGVASGLQDMYGSVSAAMNGLAGPRHGRANQDCLKFVQQILEELGERATVEEVEELLRRKLENKELIFGFGHAVLRVEDPRATVLYRLAEEKYSHHPLVKIALLLRSAGPKVLRENAKISNPYPNVDAISGVVLAAAGFSYPQYFTVLFGLSRIVGISRQIIYERCEAREGKGTPIIRPKYLHKSP